MCYLSSGVNSWFLSLELRQCLGHNHTNKTPCEQTPKSGNPCFLWISISYYSLLIIGDLIWGHDMKSETETDHS